MEKNEYVDFVVTARKYKTLLTNKYLAREVWQKPFPGDVISKLPGTIIRVDVEQGQEVKAGELLLIHEAMKMQNEIAAPHDAVVSEVRVSANQTVSTGDDMVVLG